MIRTFFEGLTYTSEVLYTSACCTDLNQLFKDNKLKFDIYEFDNVNIFVYLQYLYAARNLKPSDRYVFKFDEGVGIKDVSSEKVYTCRDNKGVVYKLSYTNNGAVGYFKFDNINTTKCIDRQLHTCKDVVILFVIEKGFTVYESDTLLEAIEFYGKG